MSVRELSSAELKQWIPFVGDFAILKELYAQKRQPLWKVLQLFDALLRGFGQVVLANNPLSGLLIAVTLAAVAPGALALSAATAVLGLLLSVLMRDSRDNVGNGLTVYNPLLIGAISYALIPQIYGGFDVFALLLVFLGTIFSVYLARSLGDDKFPCTTWPFNLVEFALICALSSQNSTDVITRSVEPTFHVHNATSETTTTTTANDADFHVPNITDVYIDWGMILQGIVVSSSQVFAIDSTVFGSVIYLAILIFSPTTAAFSFVGALIGSLAGMELGAKHDEIYNGFWGYNSLLTGAALGGNLLVLNGQTIAAAVAAIICTVFVQHCMQSIFNKMHLPILTLPFVVVVSLFVRLRNGKGNVTFPRPESVSFPEKQRYDYLASCSAFVQEIDAQEESAFITQN